MEDFIKTLRAQLYERVSSPLLGAFVVSWCIWNWRVFLIWVGDADVAIKLSLVDEYFSSWEKWGIRGFMVPAATTAFYIFVYPWIALPVYRFVQKRQADLQRVRQEFEDEKPLPQKEARELRQALELAEQKFDALIVRKDSQIQALGNEITSLQKALDAAQSKTNATEANPPPPFPEGAEKVSKTVIRPTGPTEATSTNYYGGRSSADLSAEARIVVAVLFQQKDRLGPATIRDLYDYSSELPKAQVQAALHQLTERGFIQLTGETVSLTAAGINAALGIVRNPRL